MSIEIRKEVTGMGYNLKGMRILDRDEVGELYLSKKLAGCYKLYPDNTESEIGDITFTEILSHYDAGGEFGEEISTIELKLLDGKRILAPRFIDISELSALGELEYILWRTIEKYLEFFGIQTEDGEPDRATVESVQSGILTTLEECGIQFRLIRRGGT